MFEKFCPNIHGICKDGFPDSGSYLCMFFDTVNEECTMARSIQLTVDGQRLTNQLLSMKIGFGEPTHLTELPESKTKNVKRPGGIKT